tara:strand:+ start:1477 stop:3639 length:2163 start_codon:yes stop_codon:yes gene_type:complete
MSSTYIQDYWRRAWGLEDRPKFKYGGSWADWMANFSDQMTFEEYLRMDLKEKKPHILDRKAEGGVARQPFAPENEIRIAKKRDRGNYQKQWFPSPDNIVKYQTFIENFKTANEGRLPTQTEIVEQGKFGSAGLKKAYDKGLIQYLDPTETKKLSVKKFKESEYAKNLTYPSADKIKEYNTFIDNFKSANDGRLPTQTEIIKQGGFDYTGVKAAHDQGKIELLGSKEARIKGQKNPETLKIRQEAYLGTGEMPYVSKAKGKEPKIYWKDEAQKKKYIELFQKRFEGTGFKSGAFDAPEAMSNKELAIEFYGDKVKADFEKFAPNLSEANKNKWTQKISLINSLLQKELGLNYNFLDEDTKKEGGKKRRLKREKGGWKLLSFREKRINKGQKDYLSTLNNQFRDDNKKILKYPKLIEFINLTFDPKTGTIGSKKHSFEELKTMINSQQGLFEVEHISDLQNEKFNREFPVNRQLAPGNINKGFINSITAYINMNHNNPDSKVQKNINEIEKVLKQYGLRAYVPNANKTYGADIITAYDDKTKRFPNFDRVLQAVGLETPEFEFKPVTNAKGSRIVRGMRDKMVNFFKATPLPKGVKLPIGATAAVLDFAIFNGLMGMPAPEAALGSGQWLIKNPEAAQRIGMAINAVIEGKLTLNEFLENNKDDMTNIFKQLAMPEMPFEIPKGSMPDSDRFTQMDEMMKVPERKASGGLSGVDQYILNRYK